MTRYRFGPRERGGALAGWRAGQIVTVAVGPASSACSCCAGSPTRSAWRRPIGILVLYGALATVPVAGRTGDEWLPVVVCWGARRAGRGRRRAHGRAARAAPAAGRTGRTWASCTTAPARTLTAALSLRGRSFALLGADEQDRRVGAWASVLSSLAREGSPVHRVQWVAASFPDDGQGVRSYLAAEAAPDAASACTASYDALLTDMDSHTCAHDVVLAVQVRLTRSVEVGCATLAREVGSLVRLLGDADVQVESVLSADDLAHQLLRTYEPARGRRPATAPARDPGRWRWRRRWSDGAGRRHGPRHLLGGRVAADRGAQRLPGPAPPRLGPLDASRS